MKPLTQSSAQLRRRAGLWLRDRRWQAAMLRDRFRADRRGGTGVLAIAVLPAFLIAIASLVILWKTVLVRRSLHVGTYEAVRFLSLYPTYTPDRQTWEDISRSMVVNQLRNNPFIGRDDLLGTRLEVRIDLPDIECKSQFTLDVSYKMEMPIVDPFPGPYLTLEESIQGEILCK